MRCLIVIALCFVFASAQYRQKNQFQQLLNQRQNQYQDNDQYQDQDEDQYQNQDRYQNRYGQRNQGLRNQLLGSDDLDDNVANYMDEIRREQTLGNDRGQWQQDDDQESGLDFQGDDDQEYDGQYGQQTDDYENFRGRNKYSQSQSQSQLYNEEDESSSQSDLIQEVKDANIKLASRLYKQSKDEKDDKNTVVSPLSVQLALAALNQGARGNTKKQIARVIAGRLQKQQRKQVFKTLARHLKGGLGGQSGYGSRQQGTKIQSVTGIFITQTTRAQQMFVQTVKRNLGTDVKQCNFQRQPQQCRQQINRLVAQKTQGKINHIVPQDAITDNTKMILVNALQLKAPWGRQMRQHVTKEAKFYPLDTKKVKIVQVLETQGQFKYYEDELVKIVGVPTEQKQMTLYVIVPKDKDGLTDVEKMHLQDGLQLKQLLKDVDQRVRHVGVQLPKFQIKHKIDVRRTLRKQGVTDAFDPQHADFSGITGGVQSQYGEQQQQDEDVQDEDQYEQSTFSFRRNPFTSRRHHQQQFDEDETTSGQNENKLHLNKFIHQTTIKITENGITAQTGSNGGQFEGDEELEGGFRQGRQGLRGQQGQQGQSFGGLDENEESYNPFDEITGFGRRGQLGGQEQQMVKANHAFAFVLKHNPTGQLVLVGRVIDAAQKKVNNVQQTIDNVDQL